jgi:hypothetical protein
MKRVQCSSGLGSERLRLVHSMRSVWEGVRRMRLWSPVSSKSRYTFHTHSRSLSDASGLDSWLSFSSLGSCFLPVAIPLRSDFHVLREIDGSPGGCHPPFDKPLSLSIVYALRRYAGMLSLEKIVGSTVKMQYVRTREAQPHSPSPMTLAGKASSTHNLETINVSHAHAPTVGHSVSSTIYILCSVSLYSTPVTMSHVMLPSKHITTTTR